MKLLILISSVFSSIFSLHSFNKTLPIPDKWNSSLKLTYTTHGRYYESYVIVSDTLYLEKGYAARGLKQKVKIPTQELENLLLILKNNEAAKIKTEERKYQKQDGISFVLSFKSGNENIFNLSSAGGHWGKEIRKKDLTRYNAIVDHILKIAKIKA